MTRAALAQPATRGLGRLTTLVVALVALFAVAAVPATAKASESALRERAHARIAVVVGEAVVSGVYSQAQANYVTSALLPTYVDPKSLSSKVEERTIEDFWAIVAKGTGLTAGAAQARLANGSTLLRLSGESSEALQRAIRNWLARPVLEARLDQKISEDEFDTLRDDIARAVDRLMRQPGGPDGKVTVSPRRV